MRGRLASRGRAVMARRTATHDSRVVISVGHKQPIRRAHSMAGIARSSCRHVPGRFPRSLDTVVTSYTSTWPNSRMFEGRTSPANRSVTTVAGHGRRNMSRRLACHDCLVMAFGTGSRSDTVMGKKRRRPISRPMATAAVNHGREVVRRLKGGDDAPTGGVALHTLRRRAAKNALQMAPLTHNLRMAAAERETGAAVIDFDIRADTPLGKSGIRRQQGKAAYRQKSSSNCPDKKPASCPANQLCHFVSADAELLSPVPTILQSSFTALRVTYIAGIIFPTYTIK
jgi:hypothetical protein